MPLRCPVILQCSKTENIYDMDNEKPANGQAAALQAEVTAPANEEAKKQETKATASRNDDPDSEPLYSGPAGTDTTDGEPSFLANLRPSFWD